MFDGSTWHPQTGRETPHFVLMRSANFCSAHLSLETNKDNYLIQDNYFMVQNDYRENFPFEFGSYFNGLKPTCQF